MLLRVSADPSGWVQRMEAFWAGRCRHDRPK